MFTLRRLVLLCALSVLGVNAVQRPAPSSVGSSARETTAPMIAGTGIAVLLASSAKPMGAAPPAKSAAARLKGAPTQTVSRVATMRAVPLERLAVPADLTCVDGSGTGGGNGGGGGGGGGGGDDGVSSASSGPSSSIGGITPHTSTTPTTPTTHVGATATQGGGGTAIGATASASTNKASGAQSLSPSGVHWVPAVAAMIYGVVAVLL
ncbi:hypothetical protein C8F01DRAFT_1245276 [Mycena amicta]|nr:hypothetical protein C8F01DRAFT_1245276 [Mycena amicta]